jgi:hypothetical protein
MALRIPATCALGKWPNILLANLDKRTKINTMMAIHPKFRFACLVATGLSLCLVPSQSAGILPAQPIEFPLEIESVTIKAGKDRSTPKDSICIKGTGIHWTPGDALISIYHTDPNEKILEEYLDYKRHNGKPGSVFKSRYSRMILKVRNGDFTLNCHDVDLTGLVNPITLNILSVTCGIGYDYSGTAYDIPPSTSMPANSNIKDVINGKKTIPVHLLSGVQNVLTVEKFNFRPGTDKKWDQDSLCVEGDIALADPDLNLAQQEITVTWGSFSLSIPAGNLTKAKHGRIYRYQKPGNVDGPLNLARFDLDAGTYKIKIKNTNISPPSTSNTFELIFPDFFLQAAVFPVMSAD